MMGTTTAHPADALLEAIDLRRAPVCVGLDPVVDRLPDVLRPGDEDVLSAARAVRSFSLEVLDAVAAHVPCVKLQSACYERLGPPGVAVLAEIVRAARERDLQVILDSKRGDIGISAEHYAAAAFGDGRSDPDAHANWITISAYLGEDSIRPFLRPSRGAFALVRTSNVGGDAVQGLRLDDGRTVAQAVADLVASIGAEAIGEHGYSNLGAVVGATKPDDAAQLRERMPRQIFLVPGFGAQGAGKEDIRPCFSADGRGAIVTASRSVIYDFEAGDVNWSRGVATAAERLAEDVGTAAGVR